METPGKGQSGKSVRSHVANLAPDEPVSAKHDDGVTDALTKVTATLYLIYSKASNNALELGPVPSAEVKIKGEAVNALLDTGSPVTVEISA